MLLGLREGNVKGCLTIAVEGIEFGAVGNEELDDSIIAKVDGPVENTDAVRVAQVGVQRLVRSRCRSVQQGCEYFNFSGLHVPPESKRSRGVLHRCHQQHQTNERKPSSELFYFDDIFLSFRNVY